MTNRIGDRPQFPLQNQRFDKGDANAISTYYEDLIARFTGSVYGQAWGCMSNPGFGIRTVPVLGAPSRNYITISPCVLMYSMPVDGTDNFQYDDKGPWKATILAYDPAKAGQPVQELSTNEWFASTPIKRPWILFRRQEADTNTGNKAYWNTASNTEEIAAAPLQRSEWVEFRLSLLYSDNDRLSGWHRMAYIDSWGGTLGSASTPVIVPVHWMDSLYYNQTSPPTQGTRVGMALTHPDSSADAYATGFSPTREMPALGKLVHWLAGKLGQHYSTANVAQLEGTAATNVNLKNGAFITVNAGEGGWLSTPPRGLLELDTDLTQVEDVQLPQVDSRLAAIDVFMQRYRLTPRLLQVMYVTPTVSGSWSSATFAVSAVNTDSVESFSPDLRDTAGGGPGGSLLANDLVYQLAPIGTETLQVQLTLSAGAAFEIDSVQVFAHHTVNAELGTYQSLVLTQNYRTVVFPPVTPPGGTPVTPPPITLPPGRFIRVQFVVRNAYDSPSIPAPSFGGDDPLVDVVRPFTIHIYGRSIV
jgi:hypothetical protein